ncbi:hypothetical protein P7K49_033958 [Saguinus oedipus]|uniref:Uncharacterized protein n=1 Tax=Saguinus oedipus TaxID=9490 RepID=A0ABQ9TTD9_SAGOE|nr:hypothetical protein P7K49_033958 [Saguinus oedipus]
MVSTSVCALSQQPHRTMLEAVPRQSRERRLTQPAQKPDTSDLRKSLSRLSGSDRLEKEGYSDREVGTRDCLHHCNPDGMEGLGRGRVQLGWRLRLMRTFNCSGSSLALFHMGHTPRGPALVSKSRDPYYSPLLMEKELRQKAPSLQSR